jgi:DNA-binding MarR family transcriptional regulator
MAISLTPSQPEPPPTSRVAEELVRSSGFLMARLGMAFKTRALERIEAEGYEGNHYSVLAILAEGARETQATIADALDMDPSRLVALLDSLERRDLVSRQRDPQDRRRHVVAITAAGKRELRRLRSIAKELEEEFFGALGTADRETLHRLLLALACEHDPRCGFAPTVSSAPPR